MTHCVVFMYILFITRNVFVGFAVALKNEHQQRATNHDRKELACILCVACYHTTCSLETALLCNSNNNTTSDSVYNAIIMATPMQEFIQ